jgi:hypothetical protein
VGAAPHATPTERTAALWWEIGPQEGALRGATQNTVTGMCCSRLRCVSRSCQWGLGWRRWDADMCGAVPHSTPLALYLRVLFLALLRCTCPHQIKGGTLEVQTTW